MQQEHFLHWDEAQDYIGGIDNLVIQDLLSSMLLISIATMREKTIPATPLDLLFLAKVMHKWIEQKRMLQSIINGEYLGFHME